MEIAIAEAKKALKRGDYSIGACIVDENGEVIVSGGNRVKTKRDSTKHIELELIQYAVGTKFGNYLDGCTLYSTHEPCPMCSGASVWAKLSGIVFGNPIDSFKEFTDPKAYYKWRYIDIPCELVVEGQGIEVVGGFMAEECKELFKLTR